MKASVVDPDGKTHPPRGEHEWVPNEGGDWCFRCGRAKIQHGGKSIAHERCTGEPCQYVLDAEAGR